MKIAILSDFHLGYEKTGEDAYGQAEEALKAASKTADALLISGDIFDDIKLDAEAQLRALRMFENLSENDWKAKITSAGSTGSCTNLPIIAIAGNHEKARRDPADSLGFLKIRGLLTELNGNYAVIEKGNEKVSIYGVGNTEDSKFPETVKALNPAPLAGYFNIFMFHQSILELIPPGASSLVLLPRGITPVSLDELPEGFDLYVNGHIHSRTESQVCGKPLLMPGSTVLTRMEMNFPRSEKGFYVYDTATNSYAFEIVERVPLIKKCSRAEMFSSAGKPQKVT